MICIDKLVMIKKVMIKQVFVFFVPNVPFNLIDSSKMRQLKRKRLSKIKNKLRERIVHYNADAAIEERIDMEAVCSLSEDVILPWDVQGNGKRVFFV